MNFIPHIALPKAFICFLACFAFHTIKPVERPWYHTHFHNQGGKNYQQNCSLINLAQKLRYATHMVYYRSTHKKNELYRVLCDIQAEFHHFKNILLELEQEALLAIKKKYSIREEIWEKYLTDVEMVKKTNRAGMAQPHKNVSHDPAIPADIQNILTMVLQEHHINPKSINLRMDTGEKSDNYTAAHTGIYLCMLPSKSHPTIVPEYFPAEITIFPSLLNEPCNIQIAICAHEVQHLVYQHTISLSVLYEYLPYYCSVEKKEFQLTKEYQQLVQIHEAQAEILAAIANPTIASCLKANRQQYYYPNCLYEEHFYHLSTIDMLWKLHNKLEALYFTN